MRTSSYTAGGLSTGTIPAMSISSNSLNGTAKVTQRTKSSAKKKQLNYNPRELSTAILRAKKAQSAGRVAVQAKAKLSNLMKCKGTGQYNEGELNMAIAHVKRMVQCAQMKNRNLRQEERDKKRHEQDVKNELRQEKNAVKARAVNKERNQEQKANIERMQMIQKEKSRRRELIREKKFHRNQEQSKLNEADMEYLKQQMRGLREPYSACTATGVSIDLSPEAMQLAQIQMEQQAVQQEVQQIEAGVTGMSSVVSGSAAGEAAATTVDIVV